MAKPRVVDSTRENKALHSESYTLQQSIGDLIDNSIDAKANEIHLWLADADYASAGASKKMGVHLRNYPDGLPYLHGNHSYFLIQDNGTGMSESELEKALVYGSSRDYEDYELGHFGVGMKTSTLSQAFEVTILSKKNGKVSILRMSSIHVQETEKDELLEVSDMESIYPWMLKTDGWLDAIDRISRADTGTILLMEGMHKIEDKFGTQDEREEYLETIQENIQAYTGITFQRYIEAGFTINRTDNKPPHVIRPIRMSLNGMPIIPIDPFFSKLVDSTSTNRMTLSRRLPSNTSFGGSTVPLEATSFIIPTTDDVNANTMSRINEQLTMKLDSRQNLQGLYIYRHQRLIDFGGSSPWRGVGPKGAHSANTVGRWEVQLPPHKPSQIHKLDFRLDKTKTAIPIGEKTKESMKKYWSAYSYKWHNLDTAKVACSNRIKQRTNRVKASPMEVVCKDCGTIGHFDRQSITCKKYTTSSSTGQGMTSSAAPGAAEKGLGNSPKISSPSNPDPVKSSTYSVTSVNAGNLITETSNLIEINTKHSAYQTLKNWFKSR